MDRKILSVFIASPRDLKDEREALRMVTERLNKIYGKRIGWQIELLGWEDRLAGVGRPQALINRDVDSSDLFIGMLWKRWGSSTSTNSVKYSSGFEEEFNVARDRMLTTGKPEIWLLFKHVSEDDCRDQGPQLEKVLKFKREQIEKKELLFKEFKDTAQFEELIYDDLSAYLLDLQESSLASKGVDTGTSLTTYRTTEEAKPHEKLPGENVEITKLYSGISQKLSEGNEKDIPYWDRVRSHLSSSALFSDSHLGEIFGTHEANLVYRKRKSWDLAFYERWFLIRTFFVNTTNNVPGWFWINEDGDVSNVEKILLFLVAHDKNDGVRIGAIDALYSMNYCPTLDFLKFLLDKKENDKMIFNSICLSRKCDDKSVLELLKPLLDHSNENIKEQALMAYIDILYRHNHEESFKLLIKDIIG